MIISYKDSFTCQMNSIPVYVVSCNNPERKQRLSDRFNKIGIIPNFVDPTYINDPILNNVPEGLKRTFAIFTDHLKNIKSFYESGSEYGLFCEDDIYISKNIVEELQIAVNQMMRHNLNILLVGYLLPYTPMGPHFQLIDAPGKFVITTYPNDVWGAHGYILNRDQAKRYIEKLSIEYGIRTNEQYPYCSDWILTKDSDHRGLMYPPIIVEEGDVTTDHWGQIQFHKMCKEFLYDPERHI